MSIINELTYDETDKRALIHDMLEYTFQQYISCTSSTLSALSSIYVMSQADISRYQYRKIITCVNEINQRYNTNIKLLTSERQLNKMMNEMKDEVSSGSYSHNEHTIHFTCIKDIEKHITKYKNIFNNAPSYCIGIDKGGIYTTLNGCFITNNSQRRDNWFVLALYEGKHHHLFHNFFSLTIFCVCVDVCR